MCFLDRLSSREITLIGAIRATSPSYDREVVSLITVVAGSITRFLLIRSYHRSLYHIPEVASLKSCYDNNDYDNVARRNVTQPLWRKHTFEIIRIPPARSNRSRSFGLRNDLLSSIPLPFYWKFAVLRFCNLPLSTYVLRKSLSFCRAFFPDRRVLVFQTIGIAWPFVANILRNKDML